MLPWLQIRTSVLTIWITAMLMQCVPTLKDLITVRVILVTMEMESHAMVSPLQVWQSIADLGYVHMVPVTTTPPPSSLELVG